MSIPALVHLLDNEAFRGRKSLRDQFPGFSFVPRDHVARLRLGPPVVNVCMPPILRHKLANFRIVDGDFVDFLTISRQMQHFNISRPWEASGSLPQATCGSVRPSCKPPVSSKIAI